MSYVLSIRRAENKPPFTREELERLARAHQSLVLDQGILSWSDGKGGNIEFFVDERELRADRISAEVSKQALSLFRTIAMELDAHVIGEEGEELAADETPLRSRGSTWFVLLGGLVVVVATPFVLLLALLRMPWVLWKARKVLR